MTTILFVSIIMLTNGKIKVAKEEFHEAKMPTKIWDVDVCNIVISKLIEMKNNLKYLNEYEDKVVRPLVLILRTMNVYIRTFKDKGGDKDKNRYNKLMSFRRDDDKLLEKIKPFGVGLKTCKILK